MLLFYSCHVQSCYALLNHRPGTTLVDTLLITHYFILKDKQPAAGQLLRNDVSSSAASSVTAILSRLCTYMLSSCLRRSVSALALLLFPDHVHELLKADI